MTTEENSPQQGRTGWGRAAVLLVPSLVAAGALTVAMAEGAIAASFGVSGNSFKVSVGSAEGSNISGFIGTSDSPDKKHPALLAAVREASLKKVCASAVVDVPLFGQVSLLVYTAQEQAAKATNVVADADALLGGGGIVRGVEAGRDASTLDQVSGFKGHKGGFGVQAGSLNATDLKANAWAATGGTVELTGLDVRVLAGRHECY